MKTLALVALFLAGAARAHEEGEASGGRTGPNKAVLEASDEHGLKLSEKALRRLGVRTTRLSGAGPFRLPAAALVVSQEEASVYVVRDGWHKRVEVELVSKDKTTVLVRAKGLKAGDHVVTAGAALLRVAEMDVHGGEEEGDGH
jgi:hypothetical protein